MAGIDFRDKDVLIDQYEEFGKPNFSIWQGKRLKISYDGNDIKDGSSMLNNYLEQITNSGTQSQYELLVYPEGVNRCST